jgi:glycosyltransferase involved in cell wall biosynthesis
MSRHEGFCVPVLEAMHFGKPVFVRGGTAAEEICPEDDVFAVETNLDTRTATIANRLARSKGRCQVDQSYAAHADSVLQRASDPVWQDIFASVGPRRSKV